MSDHSQFVAESLAELLTSIANGLREAQEVLSQLPTLDSFGRPMPSYHLPYLDFQLQVDMDTTEISSGSRRLRILPLAANRASSKEVSSTLSGRFVAIPPGEGRPLPVLRLGHERLSDRSLRIDVVLSNSAGEALAGMPVELNINSAASQQLSARQGIAMDSLLDSRLQRALLITDGQGRAATELQIDSRLNKQASVVLTAEHGQQFANIVVSAGRPS